MMNKTDAFRSGHLPGAPHGNPHGEFPADPWASHDPLGEALHLLRMEAVVYSQSDLSAPWGVAVPAMPGCLMFHIVTSGRCWLIDQDEAPRQLEPGVFTLIPHGEGHTLADSPDTPVIGLFDLPREQVGDHYERIRHGGGGAPTRLLCGAVRFRDAAAHALVKLLPRRIVVESWNTPRMDWMQSTLRLMAEESARPQAGGETVVTRLADILVIQAIRHWIATSDGAVGGWIGALRDPQIGRALQAIHRQPGVDWRVDSLAAEAAMSRSAFSARFQELVGRAPMRYVTDWRMDLAHAWLTDGELPLITIATRLGYGSEAAFSRAFKRHTGRTPGRVRRGDDAPPGNADTGDGM